MPGQGRVGRQLLLFALELELHGADVHVHLGPEGELLQLVGTDSPEGVLVGQHLNRQTVNISREGKF